MDLLLVFAVWLALGFTLAVTWVLIRMGKRG